MFLAGRVRQLFMGSRNLPCRISLHSLLDKPDMKVGAYHRISVALVSLFHVLDNIVTETLSARIHERFGMTFLGQEWI